MENIFLQILNMSLTAAVTVVVVLFIRLFLKKLPKKYSYLLWSVVGFRLLCPVAFNSAFSIFNLKIFERLSVTGGSSNIAVKLSQVNDRVNTVSDMTVNNSIGTVGTAAGTVSGISDTVVSRTANGTNVNIATPDVTAANMAGNSGLAPAVGINWIKVLMIVWLVGMIIMLAYGIAAYIAMAKKVRNAIWSEKNVYHSDRITSPFVFGLVRPRIYMPSFIESGASEYVMLHESYHIRRHDYIVKPIAFVLLCIHWFNPFVWAAFYFIGRDMEMSCDEAVIGKMVIQQAGVEDGMSESEVVKRYSYALLNCASHGRFNTLFQLGFGEMSVKDRIRNVLKYKKFGWIVTAVMICVCGAVLAACGTNSKVDTQEVENPITPDKMMQISNMLHFTSSRELDNPGSGITELDVKVINDKQGRSIVAWNKDSVMLGENIIPAGIYQYSDELDIDGDGEAERILQCQYGTDEVNTYRTFILDKQNGVLHCIGLPAQSLLTARAYDDFILEVKVDYEEKVRVYDCSEPGGNEFLMELRASLVGTVWDGNGNLINPDSADGLSRSIAVGMGQELGSGFNISEDDNGITADAIEYYVNIWLLDENNIKFAASLTYKLYSKEMVLQSGAILDRTESGKLAGRLDENFEWKNVDAANGTELDLSAAPRKWTEQKLEIARALYKDFVPCGANIDGVWVKSLYNEEYDLLITQETADTYGIYHGEEHISVPVELPFPTENNVEIKLVDIDGDGVAELYISAYQVGSGRDQLIGLEPLRTLVDSYSNDGNDLKVRDYVKEYKLIDTWIGEDDKVHVSTEFVMNDGQTYTLEFAVEGADKEKTDDFVMEPVFFETVISAVYPYEAKQDIRFRVNQGSRVDGNGYIFISVPMQYDDASGCYTEQGDIELYYREINPADWG